MEKADESLMSLKSLLYKINNETFTTYTITKIQSDNLSKIQYPIGYLYYGLVNSHLIHICLKLNKIDFVFDTIIDMFYRNVNFEKYSYVFLEECDICMSQSIKTLNIGNECCSNTCDRCSILNMSFKLSTGDINKSMFCIHRNTIDTNMKSVLNYDDTIQQSVCLTKIGYKEYCEGLGLTDTFENQLLYMKRSSVCQMYVFNNTSTSCDGTVTTDDNVMCVGCLVYNNDGTKAVVVDDDDSIQNCPVCDIAIQKTSDCDHIICKSNDIHSEDVHFCYHCGWYNPNEMIYIKHLDVNHMCPKR